MSFYGDLEKNKACAHHASLQIDGLEPGDTSPVRDGGGEGDVAPLKMEGPNQFTTDRHRHGWVGNQGAMRREFPMEGAKRVGKTSEKEK